MEHRSGTRIVTSLYVELWRGSENLGRWLSTNIGPGGLCLSDYKGNLNEGDFLTLKMVEKMNDPATAEKKYFERKAMVVHNSDGGMGLMWADSHTGFLVESGDLRVMVA